MRRHPGVAFGTGVQTCALPLSTENYRRSVLRAPAAGVIDSLAYTTFGGVVPPGQTILQIVPDRGILTFDARISPADVDQLHAGQDAKVNFSAFNRQTTPEIHGVLGLVSAKPIEDPRTDRKSTRLNSSH